jgi:hypothetical protein
MFAVVTLAVVGLIAPGAHAAFGVKALSAVALNEDGSVDQLAGSHPFQYTVNFEMNQDSGGNPEGTLRDIVVDLPPGLVGNPLSLPRCTGASFEGTIPLCPGNTQVGTVTAKLAGAPSLTFPIFNLMPRTGRIANLGTSLFGTSALLEASLRPSDYGVSVTDITVPTDKEIQFLSATIWGVPAAQAHDSARECVLPSKVIIKGCSSDAAPLSFLSLPTSCTGPLVTSVSIDSVQEPNVFRSKSRESIGSAGAPEGLNSCERPPFEPKVTAQPDSAMADSPSGLHVSLEIPQNVEVGQQVATAHLRDAILALPTGLTVNPSAADGLTGCALQGPEGINLPGAPEPAAAEPAKCPPSSKVGTVRIETPAVDHPLPGAVYLARQGENPFGSLIALYIAVDDPQTGAVVKIAGQVEPDAATGQLTATFERNPQLPFEHLDFDFFGGSRATLTTPSTCGTYKTLADLTPWTAPEGAAAHPSDVFQISAGPLGGPCATTEAAAPNAPDFEAGTTIPIAGTYSPFLAKLSRANGTQPITALNLTLPTGLTARFAGLQACSAAQIAAAQTRNALGEGALEKAGPSCPLGSEVGLVNVGAGSGSPFYVQGHIYLAGPYKGAPLSLAIITPAVAGPFDLGTVVVRAALYVDQTTAQGTVRSDPIPSMLYGIPLQVRSVAVDASADRFTLNPTSCDAKAIAAEALTPFALAPLTERFQVGGCAGLSYAPKLALHFKGSSKRRAHPKVIATLTAKPGEANTAFTQVKLPRAAFLDNAHIGAVCTRVQFAAEACPAGSIYGRAEAITPLLGYPLTGTVYLRTNPAHKLPDLVVAFRGPSSQPIKFELVGKTDSVNGALRNTFETAPDVPVTKFRLELFGGKRGLVILSSGLCRHRTASVRFKGHNGKEYTANPEVKASCRKPQKHK